jgi:hypothetical protein
MIGRTCQKLFLRLDDFHARCRQRKPRPCIHLRKLTDLARPWGPLQFECKSSAVKVALYRPGLATLRPACFTLPNDMKSPLIATPSPAEMPIGRLEAHPRFPNTRLWGWTPRLGPSSSKTALLDVREISLARPWNLGRQEYRHSVFSC